MDSYRTVKELSNYFNLSQQIIYKKIKNIKKEKPELLSIDESDKYLLKEGALLEFNDLIEEGLTSLDSDLLTFIVCDKIRKIVKKNSNSIIKLTRRTAIKQKFDLNEFEKLPQFIQDKYNDFSNHFIRWFEHKFIKDQLTNIIVDRSSDKLKDKTDIFDLRITLYEGNTPYDLNFIIKEEIKNLKELKLDQKDKILSCIKETDYKDIYDFNSSDNFIQSLAHILRDTTDRLTIKKIFKFIIGTNTNYKVIAKPEMVIIDFDKIEAPNKLDLNYLDDSKNALELSFNNGCNFICKLEKCDDVDSLLINFKEFPNDLELISL